MSERQKHRMLSLLHVFYQTMTETFLVPDRLGGTGRAVIKFRGQAITRRLKSAAPLAQNKRSGRLRENRYAPRLPSRSVFGMGGDTWPSGFAVGFGIKPRDGIRTRL